MWLVMTLVAAVATTTAYFVAPKKYRMDLLCLALWGLGAALFIDHVLGYAVPAGEEGGLTRFLEFGPEAIVTGVLMLVPIFAIWELYVLIDMARNNKIEGAGA